MAARRRSATSCATATRPTATRADADRSEHQACAVHQQSVRDVHEIGAFDEDRGLPVLDRVDARQVRVRRVDGAVGRGRQVVEELRALDLDARGDARRGDVDRHHLVDVGHPERPADAAQALRRVEAGDPLRAHHLAVGRQPRDVAVAILLEDLAVDRRHEDRVRCRRRSRRSPARRNHPSASTTAEAWDRRSAEPERTRRRRPGR